MFSFAATTPTAALSAMLPLQFSHGPATQPNIQIIGDAFGDISSVSDIPKASLMT
jgi:hypothetical protein